MCANGRSIVFVAENNVGEADTSVKQGTCFGKKRTSVNGIIHCDSLINVRKMFGGFKFPKFTDKKCSIDKRGNYVKEYLNFRIEIKNYNVIPSCLPFNSLETYVLLNKQEIRNTSRPFVIL